MPVGEGAACARLEILLKVSRNAFAANSYCSIDDPRGEFGSVRN